MSTPGPNPPEPGNSPGAFEAPSVEDAVEGTSPGVAPATPRPARRPPAWALVAIVLMALLLSIGLASLAVARNADPATPEAVEDVQTLVAELEMLNASLATTNDLMANAISNAAQLSAKAQAKLAGMSVRLADVDVGVGQVRSQLGGELSGPTRSELGDIQAQLQSLQATLAQRSGRLEDQEIERLIRNVAAIDKEAGIASNSGSRRAAVIEDDMAALERRLAENDGADDQFAELWASLQAERDRARALRTELRELRRTHAGQLVQLKRALALLQQRVDALGPKP